MKERDPYFDNLKAILIYSVVLSHFTNLNQDSAIMGGLNNVIHSYVGPLFVFTTGYFSKGISMQRPNEIENILYPYLVFQMLNYLFTIITGLGAGSANIFVPTYQNWYLIGVLFWRTVIPYYNFFDKRLCLLLTISLSFIIGFSAFFNEFLALYRIVYWLPMFVLGYYCKDLRSLLNKYSRYKYVITGMAVAVLCCIAFISYSDQGLRAHIAYAYTPVKNYYDFTGNFYLRVMGFLSSIFISVGLLYIIPKSRLGLTTIGEHTMYIFLMHMFLVFPLCYYLKNLPDILLLVFSIVMSALICFMFSEKLITKILNPLISWRALKSIISKNNNQTESKVRKII